MNDPHVVALFYDIKHSKSFDYSKADPLEREAKDFTIKIANDKACFTMTAHYSTKEEALKAVQEYIQVWEFDAALQRGPNAFTLEFSHPQIEDRKPPIPGIVSLSARPTTWSWSVSKPRIVVSSPYPSPPSSGLKLSPNVQSMYDRFLGYLSGREPLPSMAYFCLTMLRYSIRSNGKEATDQETSAHYRIEQHVISKTVKLSTNSGGSQARKASGFKQELTPENTRFLQKAVKAIIRRAAEVEYGPVNGLPEIKLADLP